MLIRRKQLETMADSQDEEYYVRLKAFFRTNISEQTADFDDPTLLEWIRIGVRKARAYKIHTNEGVTKFVALVLLVGREFDQEPAVNRYLKSPDLDPDLKVHVLSEMVSRNLRA